MPKLVLAALLLWVPRAQAQGNPPDTFVYAITGDVDSLDPDWAFDAISQEIQFQVYETLVFFKGSRVDMFKPKLADNEASVLQNMESDPTGLSTHAGATDAFEPMLASVVPDRDNGLLSSDGLRYAFPIRKKVSFHDGRSLTAEDAKYSLMRFLLTDRAGGPSYLLLEPLLGIANIPMKNGKPDPEVYRQADEAVTVEGNAVVIHLKNPYQPLLSILASFAPIVSKKWVEDNGGWDGRLESWYKYFDPPKQQASLYERENGTGPFKLERWDKENKQVILSRNDIYWRAPAKIKNLVFKTVNEPATRKLMLQAGDADAAMMEREYLTQFQGLDGIAVTDDLPLLETHDAFVMTFRINPTANPYIGSGKLDGDGIPSEFFSDVNIRRGFAHAFDYEAYIRDGYRGKAERARGPIPKGVFGYNPIQGVFDFDLGKAAEEFKKAQGGAVWDKGFRFTLTFVEGFNDRQLACQILKKNVESLNPNFKIDLRGIQQSTWLSQYTAHMIPMANARWELDYADPDSPMFAFLHSQGYYGANSGYSNPRADRFIEAARAEPDRDLRRNDYYELQAIAFQDVPQIYTVDTYYLQVNRTAVKGWYYNPIVMYGYLYPVSKEPQ
jgi:peptide/nickel transport system substrate-binding protein